MDDELSKANQVEIDSCVQRRFFFENIPGVVFKELPELIFNHLQVLFLLEKKLPELSPSIDPFENAPMPFCVKMHIKGSRIESLLHDAQRYFCTGSFESMTNGTGPSR